MVNENNLRKCECNLCKNYLFQTQFDVYKCHEDITFLCFTALLVYSYEPYLYNNPGDDTYLVYLIELLSI